MKRPLIICALIVLSALIIYACGSTIPTGNTSFVTISIGGDSRTAKLHAEQATPWTRLKYFIADAKLMPEAQAYVPSVVQVIVVTVSAADITTPIVGIDSLTPDQTSSTIRIEVPNGAARLFTVEGIRGIDSATYYRGAATADLDGTEVNLPISMGFVGPGIWVDPSRPLAANTPTCGSSQAAACATITYALNSRTTGTDAILAAAGNYFYSAVAAFETFPLRLKTGTALICMGTNHTSIINLSSMPSGTVAVKGAEGASIDSCLILGQSATAYVGIDDRQGTTVLNKGMKINNVEVQMPAANTFGTSIGIALYSDSPVIESTVTGTGGFAASSAVGVQVNSGKPTVTESLIQSVGTGIGLTSGAGDALITRSTISGNAAAGVSSSSPGSPVISSSRIVNNGTGIVVNSGNPAITANLIENNSTGISIIGSASGQITGNTIGQNSTGIAMSLATGGNPRANGNSIFCNTFLGANVSATGVIDLKNNAWNRDATTSIPGPIVNTGNCFAGDDICYAGPAPEYIPFNAAVPNGCVNPIGKPVK